MKKLVLLSLALLVCGYTFQSCDDSKTYAEQKEDERNAINKFIRDNNIKVITAQEFENNGYETDVAKNEYAQFPNGVYVQIVDKGDLRYDSIRSRDVVVVRVVEYDIMAGDTTGASNFMNARFPDSFDYTVSGTEPYGQFRVNSGEVGAFYTYYQETKVPEGWVTPLKYLRHNSRVKLIVPHEAGHEAAANYVAPYYYDLRRIQVWMAAELEED